MMAFQKQRILGAVLWVVGRKVENAVGIILALIILSYIIKKKGRMGFGFWSLIPLISHLLIKPLLRVPLPMLTATSTPEPRRRAARELPGKFKC